MRTVKMTSKRNGVCIKCGKPIRKGTAIYWDRSRGAWHASCDLQRDENGRFVPDPVDMAYEDACARACGMDSLSYGGDR